MSDFAVEFPLRTKKDKELNDWISWINITNIYTKTAYESSKQGIYAGGGWRYDEIIFDEHL